MKGQASVVLKYYIGLSWFLLKLCDKTFIIRAVPRVAKKCCCSGPSIHRGLKFGVIDESIVNILGRNHVRERRQNMNLKKNNLFKYKGIRHYYFFLVLIKIKIDLIQGGSISIILPGAYKMSGTTLFIIPQMSCCGRNHLSLGFQASLYHTIFGARNLLMLSILMNEFSIVVLSYIVAPCPGALVALITGHL